jgi:hypothetical protein
MIQTRRSATPFCAARYHKDSATKFPEKYGEQALSMGIEG